MFWGLIMEPQKRYTQTVQRSFHISMAALDVFSADDKLTQLILTFEDRNYLLCTLQKGNIIQTPLDLNFHVGDEVVFAVNGHSNIHLSGYLLSNVDDQETEAVSVMQCPIKNKRKVEKEKIPSKQNNTASNPLLLTAPAKKSKLAELLEQEYNSEEDESFKLPESEEEDDEDDEIDSNAEDEEEEMEEEEDSEREVEQAEDEEDDEADFSLDENESSDEEQKEEKKEVKPKINGTATKKQKLQLKLEVSPPKSEKATPKKEKKPLKVETTPSTQKRAIEGGVIIQDLKIGNGLVAKAGKVVQVYYEGRLKQNNKVFDQTNKGSGFKFRLGKQEVIKGWDVGVVGMQVGGKRRIVCPPQMAYGQKGSPPVIPPNSTLIFEVELKNVI